MSSPNAPKDTTTPLSIPIRGKGTDSTGTYCYENVQEMWTAFGISANSSRQEIQENWYDRAADWYEENCPPTINGVLGGFAKISDCDLAGSKLFLRELQSRVVDFSKGAACECGAGIGRVTKGLLLDLNPTQVDVVEASSRLLCESPEYIGDEGAKKCRFYCTGLQDWNVPENRYSLIWIQWVLCYLTDHDVVEFLKRCAKGLIPGGVIVLKENTCGGDDTFVVDTDDASVCRSLDYWLNLVEVAGLKVIYQKMQDDFPDELFSVPMLALQSK